MNDDPTAAETVTRRLLDGQRPLRPCCAHHPEWRWSKTGLPPEHMSDAERAWLASVGSTPDDT